MGALRTLAVGVALAVGVGALAPPVAAAPPTAADAGGEATPPGREAGQRLIHDRTSATVRIAASLDASAFTQLAAGHGLEVVGSLPALGAVQVRATDRRPIAAALATLRREPGVLSAEPAVPMRLAELPDDPYFPQQWGLDAINAASGWDRERGSFGVIVAIVDSGVDPNHPELRPKLLPGWDFIGRDGSPADTNGHGTMVAGIAAAATDNGQGVAGTSWASEILPVRVIGPAGGTDQTVADGIVFAVDRGARVINLSLAGDSPSGLLGSAINYASDHGAVVVAATGNEGASAIAWPARYPKTIAVGAVERQGSTVTHAPYSNKGQYIDVVAPGSGIVGPWPGNRYVIGDGTSFAAPFVSGLAALLLSRDPRLTPAQVSSRLRNTAQDLGAVGYDTTYGAGLVDASAALAATADPNASDTRSPWIVPRGLQPATAVSGRVSVGAATSDPAGVTQLDLDFGARIRAFRNPLTSSTAFSISTSWDTTRSPDGLRTWTARAVDPAGLVRRLKVPALVANDHALVRVARTATTGATSWPLGYRATVTRSSPFVYRVSTTTAAQLTLTLLREDGSTAASATASRSVYLALSSIPAGAYRVRIVSSLASTPLTISGAWYR
jgi:subtilisin family serine protease